MAAFGLIGYAAKKLDFPIAPLPIGLVLGNLTETNLRRSLMISGGNPLIFFTRPISAVILAVSFISLLMPYIRKMIDKKKAAKAQAQV